MSWFLSTLICLVLEGAYFGAAQNSIINDLSIMTTISLGPLVVPVFNVNFAQGIMRLLLWDYSFYTGGWIVIRYFWVCTLSSARCGALSRHLSGLRSGHQFYYPACVRGNYERIKEFFITIRDFYYGHDNTAVCWCFLSGDAIYYERVY